MRDCGVCEECRWGECGYTKATPGCGRGMEGEERRTKGRTEQSNIPWYTSSGNTLDPALCAHIAYSYWSLMAENVLIRVIVVENCEARALVCFFFLFLLKVDMWGEVRLLKKCWNDPSTKLQRGIEGLVGVVRPTSLTYVGTPRKLALGLAFAVMGKPCYGGVLCLVHFKKAQTSPPFIFSTGETERWHWGQSFPSILLFFLTPWAQASSQPLCDHSITLSLPGLDALLKC